MKRPKFSRASRFDGWVAAWGRLGVTFGRDRDDADFWRLPRVEPHRDDKATGILIGWRRTGLAVVFLHPVVCVDLLPPVEVDGE